MPTTTTHSTLYCPIWDDWEITHTQGLSSVVVSLLPVYCPQGTGVCVDDRNSRGEKAINWCVSDVVSV